MPSFITILGLPIKLYAIKIGFFVIKLLCQIMNLELKPMNIENNSKVKFMTVQEIKRLYDNDEINLIDVREIEEWKKGHIPGAKFIPLSKFSINEIDFSDLNERHLVIHCRSGRRCGIAAEKIISSGYNGEIIRMKGGIIEWEKYGYKINS